MNKSLYFIVFVAGAVAGSVATWQCTKKIYEQMAQEEIDSVKETFSRLKEKTHDESNDEQSSSVNTSSDIMAKAIDEGDKIEYSKIIDNCGYNEEKEEVENMNKRPYVIKPDEFGELDGYETRTLTYYAVGYLVDPIDDEIIEEIEELVSFDVFNHFGEYEEDAVYVRNDVGQCDYEILQDEGNFEDIINGI